MGWRMGQSTAGMHLAFCDCTVKKFHKLGACVMGSAGTASLRAPAWDSICLQQQQFGTDDACQLQCCLTWCRLGLRLARGLHGRDHKDSKCWQVYGLYVGWCALPHAFEVGCRMSLRQGRPSCKALSEGYVREDVFTQVQGTGLSAAANILLLRCTWHLCCGPCNLQQPQIP